ncbi:ABC transporter substrate-binding protein [Alicyclobacillus shizuokensis]|uniref:ABC transporter substrate-binding protein n=1 Tax=Alicyclobacillus shizuokensis TaxID=392014 RepID=UPI00082C7B4F|nr:ABC transporter substrate-binding protein [Alicyclobacillus shizuokensis]
MKKTWKLGSTAAVAIALSATVAGCGSSSGGNSSGNSSGKANTTQSQGSAQGQPIVMVPAPYGSFQRNFNPFQTTSNPGTDGFIYEPLYYYNLVGPEKYGILGKSMAWSNGNKTLTVTLRDNAKWSDGQKFTSQDVVYTFNLLKKNPALDTSGVWQELADVKADGDYKVVFDFKKPDVPFAMYVLETYIVPEHIWKNISDPRKTNNENPVGTGPYVLDTFTSQDYKFKANPNYYLGKPPVPEIEIPSYNSNDSANLALAKGEADWSSQFIPNIKNVYTSKSPNNHYWFPPNNNVQVIPNLKNPILSNLTVRKAISLAIDRGALIQKAEYGYPQASNPTGVLLPIMKDWLDPSLPKQDTEFTYNQQQAVKLLQDAGFKKNSNGIFETPDGKPLSFTMQVVAGWTDWDMSAQLIAQDLQKVGIKVQVQQQQYGGYISMLQSHKFELAIYSSGTGPNPYYIYKTTYGTGGPQNYEQFSNAEVDKALQAFSTTTDENTQKQEVYKIEKIVAETLPTIPLFEGPTWYEYNDSKYTGWPDADHPYVTPAAWAWPAPEIVVMHLKPRS